MSVDQAQRTVNQLDSEIAVLEKKMAELTKKEADRTRKINDVKRSITKNTSSSMLSSKARQIDGYSNELVRITSDQADVSKRLAEKRKRRSDAYIQLQKEQGIEDKKAAQYQQRMQAVYEKQIAELTAQIATRPIAPDTDSHIYAPTGTEEYDVFISHATEDKATFVDEFVRILKEVHGLKVWYDKDELRWGDSIRAKIDDGLRRSKVGVVVLSRYYMRKYWTSYEYEGLLMRESQGGKIVLPIWHDITKQEVMEYSPTLAGKMAMLTALLAPAEIADALMAILNA